MPKGGRCSVIGDFFRIIHVQNPAIAFSIGRGIAGGHRAGRSSCSCPWS